MLRSGTGPRLLFLGGTGWDLRADTAPFSTPLADQFDIVHFDQRGMGQTEKTAGPYTMQDYADDAAAVLDALDWPDAVIVGFSFGAMVAQELAIRHPKRVRAMALISSAAGGLGGSAYPIHELNGLPTEEKTRKSLEISDLRFSTEYQTENPKATQLAVTARLPQHPEYMLEPGAAEGRQWQLEARAAHNCYDRLHGIKVPVLVIGGESDGQAPAPVVANLANAIPQSTLLMLPGAHGLIFENDDALNAVVAFFTELHEKPKT